MFRSAFCLFTLAASAMLSGCSVNPATGDRQLNLISVEEEIKLGVEAQPGFLESNGGLIPDAGVVAYVEELGGRLAAVSERPDLPWEFHAINSAQINAFALPGGKVFISRGLMAQMTDEAQLAGVLGHEIGHVTAQHVSTRMTQAAAVQMAASAVSVAAGAVTDSQWLQVLGVGAEAGGSAYLLKFGRDQERESDVLGVRYMVKLGYDPQAQVAVMEILKRAAGDGAGPEFFATHPLPQTRIDYLNEKIDARYPGVGGVLNAKAYSDNVLTVLNRLPPATQ